MRGDIPDDGSRLTEWLRKAGISEIRIVSPHLDDAAFSLAEFLSRPSIPPRIAMTIFTEAGPATGMDYARSMGFADADEEFRCRRAENAAAMQRLGAEFTHCGLESGRQDIATAEAMQQIVLDGMVPDQTLLLLPLGAGSALPHLRRLARRILRIPPGCDAHGEHLWVRDQLCGVAAAQGARLGFYAEIPYQWANSPAELAERARVLAAGPVDSFALKPDLEAKLAVLQDYASQFEAEFGSRLHFQKRSAGISERIFLPALQAQASLGI